MQFKTNFENLMVQIIHDTFARGMKVGAQMYVALMKSLEEEYRCWRFYFLQFFNSTILELLRVTHHPYLSFFNIVNLL